MYVPCILSGNAVLTWFKSMGMLFGCLKKKKTGQALKPTTARQVWTLTSFKFLEAHLTIRMDTRQLGKVVVPTVPALPVEVEEEEEEEEEEEGGDDNNAASVVGAMHAV